MWVVKEGFETNAVTAEYWEEVKSLEEKRYADELERKAQKNISRREPRCGQYRQDSPASAAFF
jgi:hypothetical protein